MDKLLKMKEDAIKNNDAIVFNSIRAYEKHGNDPTVLIQFIKKLYEENKELNQKLLKYEWRNLG